LARTSGSFAVAPARFARGGANEIEARRTAINRRRYSSRGIGPWSSAETLLISSLSSPAFRFLLAFHLLSRSLHALLSTLLGLSFRLCIFASLLLCLTLSLFFFASLPLLFFTACALFFFDPTSLCCSLLTYLATALFDLLV
jgi:hypothetical protein